MVTTNRIPTHAYVSVLSFRAMQRLFQGPARCKDIEETLMSSDGRPRFRAPVHSLLNVLQRKGWVRIERGKNGRSILYHASITPDELRAAFKESLSPDLVEFLGTKNETNLSNRHLINYPSLIQVIDAQSQVLALDGKS